MNYDQQLASANKRLQAVLDTAVDAIITIDKKGIVQSFNRAAERMFGYSADEVLGNNIKLIMPPPFHDEHDGYLKNYLETGIKKIIGIGREVEARCKDGTLFPAEIAVSETRLGSEVLFTGFVRDITARKQAELDLARREAFLQTIFDSEPTCVKVLHPGGILVRMNRAGLDLIGAKSLAEVEGKCIYPLVTAEYRDAFRQLAERIFAGESGTMEFEIDVRRGRRRMETHAVPLVDQEDGVTAMLAFSRDVTDHRTAEERALQSERLAAIGQTVTGLAHESRNAFQRSQACLEMLAIELEGQDEALQLVSRTQRALDHLHHLYEEVRDFAAPIKLDRQACVLPHVWRDAWSHLEVTRAGKQIEFSERLHNQDQSRCTCHCDWFAVGQVFRNVLENAIVACPDPGRIEIHLESEELAGKPALRVRVRDNGPGIPVEARERVFDAFYTTKTKGTGLGMAIAKRIVEAHGGEIDLGPSASGGAEFVITLPHQ